MSRKIIQLIALSLCFLTLGVSLTACGNNKKEGHPQNEQEEKEPSKLSDKEFNELLINGAKYVNRSRHRIAIEDNFKNLKNIKVYYDDSRERFIVMYNARAPYFVLQKDKGNLKEFMELEIDEANKLFNEGKPVRTYDIDNE